MVAPVGLEPTTKSLKGFCSNQLSYKAIENCFKELTYYLFILPHFLTLSTNFSFFRWWPPSVKGRGSSAIRRCSRGVLLPPCWKNENLLLLYLTANFQRINFFFREVWTYKYIQIYVYVQKNGIPTRNRIWIIRLEGGCSNHLSYRDIMI